ncbi:hypothetical protein LTR64_007677 [Lithohypha guttulata]|uniref:uncharacterized protein n=1 Tax=Lithohypha guttulata TaxID=1690604 RepID=UPI002DE068C8|nr:hypothetical protein LTR51_007186 [Lithohypha guttulata]
MSTTKVTTSLPSSMTAVQVVEFHKPWKINTVPTPNELGDYDILVKTAVASLCHTDSMVLDGVFPNAKLPQTGSHEGTGTVVEVGKKVENFKKGDRVMSGIPREQCGSCRDCKGPNDWHQYCANAKGMIGVFGADGAFADYHVSDSRTSCLVPDSVSLTDAAPLACAGVTIYRAIIVSEAKKGDWLAMVGAGGGLGHLGIQMAKAQGIKVIAIDARDEALELCKKAGAEHVFDARKGKDEVVKQIQELTGGDGADATINLSEHETAAPLACAVTKMHGNMIQISQPAIVSIPFAELVFRDVRVKGSLVAGQDQSQAMLDLVGKAGIKVETNIFNGLNEVPKMIDLAHSGKMKGKAVCAVDKSQV